MVKMLLPKCLSLFCISQEMLHGCVSVQSPDGTEEANVLSPETTGIVLYKDIFFFYMC